MQLLSKSAVRAKGGVGSRRGQPAILPPFLALFLLRTIGQSNHHEAPRLRNQERTSKPQTLAWVVLLAIFSICRSYSSGFMIAPVQGWPQGEEIFRMGWMFWLSTLPALLIGLREGLEAALVVGIVLGVLARAGRPHLAAPAWLGVGSAVAVSGITAAMLQGLGTSLQGSSEAIFEALTMLLAAALLSWMIFWMSRVGKNLSSSLADEARRAISRKQGWGVFAITFFSVLREGVETALFLVAAAFRASPQETLVGGGLGLALAACLGWGLFATALRLNLRSFFSASGALLLLFAAGLVGHSIQEFNQAGWVPAIIDPLWNTNGWVNETSFTGQILKALFGYSGSPSLTQVLAYLVYFAGVSFAVLRGRVGGAREAKRA